MTQHLDEAIDEVLEAWRATRGDSITLSDVSRLIDALTMTSVAELALIMGRKGMTIDQINAELGSTMPMMVKLRAELMAQISTCFTDPDEPTTTLQ